MKAHLPDLKIPCLSEAATDEEIEAARKVLGKLQETLREIQREFEFRSQILFDRYDAQKRGRGPAIFQPEAPGNLTEETFEEISKRIMGNLSSGKKCLARDHVLLNEIA